MACSATQAATVTEFDRTENKTKRYLSGPLHLLTVEDAVRLPVENNALGAQTTIEYSLSDRRTAKNKLDGMGNPRVVRYTLLGGGHNSVKINNEGADLNRTIWDFVSQYELNRLRERQSP